MTSQSHYRLYQDCRRLSTSSDPSEIIRTAVAAFNRLSLEACKIFAIHASVVALNNRFVAFPADSGGGKTTLAAAMLKTDFEYVSDEALVISDKGTVVAYPKPLALSAWSRSALSLDGSGEEQLYLPRDLDAKLATREGTLTDIVISHFGLEKAALTELPPSKGVTALLSHSFNHYKNPERAFRLAVETARNANVWRLEYGDPLEAAALLRDRLG